MMMLARHFKQPRYSHQIPCNGTGLVVDVEPLPASSTEHQHATCSYCDQSVVLTTVTPNMSRGGAWGTP